MLTTNTYVLGAQPRLQAMFLHPVTGVATDPDTVTFKITEPTDPDATVTTYTYGVDAELVRESAGVYYVDWATTVAGEHCYRFQGAGVAVRGVAERHFDVDAGCFE